MHFEGWRRVMYHYAISLLSIAVLVWMQQTLTSLQTSLLLGERL